MQASEPSMQGNSGTRFRASRLCIEQSRNVRASALISTAAAASHSTSKGFPSLSTIFARRIVVDVRAKISERIGSIYGLLQRHRREDYWRCIFDAPSQRYFHAELLLHLGYERSEDRVDSTPFGDHEGRGNLHLRKLT
jgi:hypothetical protein